MTEQPIYVECISTRTTCDSVFATAFLIYGLQGSTQRTHEMLTRKLMRYCLTLSTSLTSTKMMLCVGATCRPKQIDMRR